MTALQPNPWLKKAIQTLMEVTSDRELHAKYGNQYQTGSEQDWDSFLWDQALQHQLILHPELKTRTDDMPLSTRIKDIFKANYIEALVMLVQMTGNELRRIPGLTADELEEITNYLDKNGFQLEEGETSTVKQAWEDCFKEKNLFSETMRSLEKRRKLVREEWTADYDDLIHKEILYFDETETLLLKNKADKGTMQRFLWKYANFLYDNMNVCPNETGMVLTIAKRELALKEYLFGHSHRQTAKSLELVGNIYQALKDYRQAIPYHERALCILGKEKGNLK
jgi:tetratricopeptide (TPR) repeat protein